MVWTRGIFRARSPCFVLGSNESFDQAPHHGVFDGCNEEDRARKPVVSTRIFLAGAEAASGDDIDRWIAVWASVGWQARCFPASPVDVARDFALCGTGIRVASVTTLPRIGSSLEPQGDKALIEVVMCGPRLKGRLTVETKPLIQDRQRKNPDPQLPHSRSGIKDLISQPLSWPHLHLIHDRWRQHRAENQNQYKRPDGLGIPGSLPPLLLSGGSVFDMCGVHDHLRADYLGKRHSDPAQQGVSLRTRSAIFVRSPDDFPISRLRCKRAEKMRREHGVTGSRVHAPSGTCRHR